MNFGTIYFAHEFQIQDKKQYKEISNIRKYNHLKVFYRRWLTRSHGNKSILSLCVLSDWTIKSTLARHHHCRVVWFIVLLPQDPFIDKLNLLTICFCVIAVEHIAFNANTDIYPFFVRVTFKWKDFYLHIHYAEMYDEFYFNTYSLCMIKK